jgi:hypothetical protein
MRKKMSRIFDSMMTDNITKYLNKKNHVQITNKDTDLLADLHQQVNRWIKDCDEMMVEREVIEDLSMIKIMIEGWINSHSPQSASAATQ